MEIKIGERTIPMVYTTYEAIAIQREIGCTVYQLNDEVFGIRQLNEDDPESIVFDCVTDADKTEKLGRLIRILGNAGLEEIGEEGNLTDKWVLRHIKQSMILPYAIAMIGVINEGNRMETSKEPKGPVDETLEEERTKKSTEI